MTCYRHIFTTLIIAFFALTAVASEPAGCEPFVVAIDAGHGGSDFYAMWNAIEFIKGNPDAEVIDVYEALDMYLPGLCAYFSVLEGGIPVKVPDMRDKATRDLYRNDTRCTDPKVAGDQLLPTTSRGTPEIPDEIYDMIRKKFEECPEV